jgi:S1-C subfamily serine protease
VTPQNRTRMTRLRRIATGQQQANIVKADSYRSVSSVRFVFCCLRTLILAVMLLQCLPSIALPQSSLADIVAETQPKIAKIFGAGGLRGLEAYQSGFLISGEGHILTVWSYVLDSDVVTVYLNDGRRLTADVLGMDPRSEIAVLKIDAQNLPHFNLEEAVTLGPGAKVLALSNMFGVALGNEPASVLHGVVAAKTELAARRGAFDSNYRGPAYILDAMTNNPGAPGGALTDAKGRLAGLVGKELRSSTANIWINYAIPIGELQPIVDQLVAGKFRPAPRDDGQKKPKEPHTLVSLGMELVPDFLPRTPPFVECVKPGSTAAKAGLKPDDLVLFINGRVVPSCKLLTDELSFIDRLDPIRLTVQRGQELIEVELVPEP